MKNRNHYLLLACCFIGAFLLSGWGFLGHRTIHQLAIYQLPESLRQFFYENKKYMVTNSTRPDERRNADKTEETKHFIDAEAYGDSALWKMPQNWDEAVAKYSADTLKKYGYLPYWVITMKEKLTNAFRQKNKDSILFYAADMAHYVSDAHVPLHTTMNYDGQLTGQKGLHSLWESAIPEIEITNYQLYARHKARYLNNPQQAIWEATRGAYILLNNMFLEEKEASKGFTDSAKYVTKMRYGKMAKVYTEEFARAYNKRLGNTINEQLVRASQLSADFWYTCWVDAGKPDITSLTPEFDKAEKRKLKAERKAYRKNQLIDKKLLMSKQYDKEI